MQRAKGSITIFSLLSLLLITAALFALLEGTRLQEIRRLADLQTVNALESAFAGYNTCLWEKYHILGTQHDKLEQQVKSVANGRIGKGANLLQMKLSGMKITELERLTDAKGRVFIRSAATYMKDNWVYEAAKEIYSQYEAIKHLMEDSSLDENDIGDALQEVEDAKNSSEKTASRARSSVIDVEEILKEAKGWQEQGILNLMIKDTGGLSDSKQDFSDGLCKRKLQKGTNAVEEITWQERLLFQQYLMTYMSNFHSTKENHALFYEAEYLLGGKESDIENLKVVVWELLAIREVINFTFLVSNPQKQAQVEAASMLVAGATLNPMAVNVIKVGIMAAWALGESILDVRALMAGKRIPLLKSEDTWTTELEKLNEIASGEAMAKEAKWGLGYEEYLTVLLLMAKEEDVAMRAMNAQEATIRTIYKDKSFRMDTLLAKVNMEAVYSYQPIFPFLQVIDAEERWEYKALGNAAYGYY